MIGPQLPKPKESARTTQQESGSRNELPCQKSHETDSSDDEDEGIIGPQLLAKEESVTKITTDGETSPAPRGSSARSTFDSKRRDQKTLLQLHQEKLDKSGVANKNRVTKFDHKEGLNREVREEIMKNLNKNGGLGGRFTKGSDL